MTSGARVGSLDHRVHVVLGQLSAPYHHHFSLCDWHVFCGRHSEATPISCSSVGNIYTLDLATVDDSCLSQLLLIIVVKWWFSVSMILYLLNYKLALYYIFLIALWTHRYLIYSVDWNLLLSLIILFWCPNYPRFGQWNLREFWSQLDPWHCF